MGKPLNPNKPENEFIHVTEIPSDLQAEYVLGCELFAEFYRDYEKNIRKNMIQEPVILLRSIYLAGFMAGKQIFETE